VAYLFLDLNTQGSVGLVIAIAIANAVLGVALGLFCSAFARTEFQAVQFMPVVVVPQLLLCGLFVPREQMAGWLQAISDVLPMTYAVEALQQVGMFPELTETLWRDLGIVVGCVVLALTLAAATLRRRVGLLTRKAPLPWLATGSARSSRCAPQTFLGHKGALPREGTRRIVVRTGRRPGNQETREAILAAAREAFADRGFDASSIRSIALAAGVDPALVHHYFGTKDQLFLDALQAPFDPTAILTSALDKGADGVGERLVRTALSMWDSPAGGAAVAIVRSAVSNDVFARMLREFVMKRIMRKIARDLHLDPAEGDIRAALVASQMAGLVMMRYVVKIEPIASMPPEMVVATIGPTMQRYLTGPLPRVVTP
jgi:AcrR family transcriptional regulator